MFAPVLNNPWVRVGLLIGAVVLFCFLVYALSAVVIPLLSAFLVAYIFDPVVDMMERRKIGRGTAIGVLVGIFAIIVVLFPVYIIPSAIGQAIDLLKGVEKQALDPDGLGSTEPATPKKVVQTPKTQAPTTPPIAVSESDPQPMPEMTEDSETAPEEQLSRVEMFANEMLEKLPLGKMVEILGWRSTEDTAASLGDEEIILRHIAQIAKDNRQKFQQTLTNNLSSIGSGLGSTFFTLLSSISSLGQGLLGIILFFANLAVFAFVAGYLLRDFDGLVASMGELVPPKYRKKTFSIVGQIDVQVRSFLRGQLTVCACMAIMYATGFAICGVPFWVLIAIWGGFAAFIPFFGATLTVVPAAIFALLQYGFDWHVIGVFVTFVVVQFVEGNLLTPNIVGNSVGLHPVWVILAVLVFGSVFGFVGLLIAVPLAACLKVLVIESIAYYRTSSLFVDDVAGPGLGD